ncbi:MAG TPA: hypothetical protein VN040_16025 [Pseudosphingobacterium sp.]|nr:hypothetical protein [Pseudosphingobacterium sp.]
MERSFTYDRLKGYLPIFKYRDHLPKVLAAGLMACLVCFYGYRGALLAGMTEVPFFVVFGFGFIVSLGILQLIRYFTLRFDRRYNWLSKGFMRLVYQLLLCWLLPVMLVFLLSLLFFSLLPVSIRESDFLYTDFVLVVLLVLISNLFYALTYFVQLSLWLFKKGRRMAGAFGELKRKQKEDARKMERMRAALRIKDKQLEQQQKDLEALKEQIKNISASLATKEKEFEVWKDVTLSKKVDGMRYIVKTGKETRGYTFSQIACFFKLGKLIFLQLMEGGRPIPANEASLRAVDKNTENYFTLGPRDYLIAQHAIARCKRMVNGKLLLILKEPLEIEVELSKERGQELRNWILQVVSIEEEA